MLSRHLHSGKLITGLTVLLLVGLLIYFAVHYLPAGVDWERTIRPACQALARGGSPYQVVDYLGFPPWVLFLLIPLGIMPTEIGRAIFVVSLMGFTYSAVRLEGKPIAVMAFLLSAMVILSLLNANLDWMPVLGFVLPPQVGHFLVMAKPQMGSVVALFWLVEAWRQGGFREALRIFLPITLVTLISFVWFVFWPKTYVSIMDVSQRWNASL